MRTESRSENDSQFLQIQEKAWIFRKNQNSSLTVILRNSKIMDFAFYSTLRFRIDAHRSTAGGF